jgi:uncharacterized membrane protein YeaQ/YmgE (transglycosylase-associated protein family)
MIIAFAFVAVIGLATGAVSDELLRGRDPRSRGVILAGLAGAVAGLVVRRGSGSDGLLIGTLSAFVGALILAFIMRVRLSATVSQPYP